MYDFYHTMICNRWQEELLEKGEKLMFIDMDIFS